MTELDHLYGRKVENVVPGESEENNWAIQMEGDALIRNYDEKTEIPDGIDGTVLLGSTYDDGVSTLSFGYSGPEGAQVQKEIALADYTVVGPGDDDPQVEPVGLPEDPSPDRVWDGPEGE